MTRNRCILRKYCTIFVLTNYMEVMHTLTKCTFSKTNTINNKDEKYEK